MDIFPVSCKMLNYMVFLWLRLGLWWYKEVLGFWFYPLIGYHAWGHFLKRQGGSLSTQGLLGWLGAPVPSSGDTLLLVKVINKIKGELSVIADRQYAITEKGPNLSYLEQKYNVPCFHYIFSIRCCPLKYSTVFLIEDSLEKEFWKRFSWSWTFPTQTKDG